MEITSAEYLTSGTEVAKCPPANLPEFAFIGRSNVGKSSLINMLVAKERLAKTSSNPGKTQTINHFKINSQIYLVDLPGYGFARVSQDMRKKWTKFIWEYLSERENLMSVFVLIDSRIAPQKNDLSFINRLGQKSIPFTVCFTKADKVSKKEANKNIDDFKKAMLADWEELPEMFVTSAEEKTGREKILDFMEKCTLMYHKKE